MELIKLAKELLKKVIKGDLTSTIKELKWKRHFYRNDETYKSSFSELLSSESYKEKYDQIKKLNNYIFKLGENPLFIWLLGAGKWICLGILSTILSIYVTLNWEKWFPVAPDCTPDQCGIVVTDFIDYDGFSSFLKDILIEDFNIPVEYCPLNLKDISNDYLSKTFFPSLKPEPLLLISGHYSKKNKLTIKLYEVPEFIMKELNINTTFLLEDTDKETLKDSLVSQRYVDLFIQAIKVDKSCHDIMLKRNNEFYRRISNIPKSNHKNRAYRFNAESNFASGQFEYAERAMNDAIKNDESYIENYALRGRVRDTLNNFNDSYDDYNYFIDHHKDSNASLGSNYKVRELRRRLINKQVVTNNTQIIGSIHKRNELMNVLQGDLKFYKDNPNFSGINISQQRKECKKLISKLKDIKEGNNEIEKRRIIGSISDEFGKGLSGVKIYQNRILLETTKDQKIDLLLANNINELSFSKDGFFSQKVVIPSSNKIAVSLNRNSDILNTSKKSISGTLYDGNKEVIAGAEVKSPNNDIGTVTDKDGTFVLNVPDTTVNLHFSHFGYKPKIVTNRYSNNWKVVLKETTKTVKGIVTDNSNTNLAKVSITAIGNKINTNSSTNGQFSIEVPSSVTSLKLSKSGYQDKIIQISENNIINAKLAYQTKSVKGFVLENEIPISGVKVFIQNENINSKTNKNGMFSISVPNLTKELSFSCPGYKTKTVSIPNSIIWKISLEKEKRNISGKIVDNNNQPLGKVKITPANGGLSSFSESDGIYSIEIPLNITSLNFSKSGYQNRTIPIPSNNTINTFLKKSTKIVRGIIRDQHQNIIRDATIKIGREILNPNWIGNGEFEIEVPLSTRKIVVEKIGYYNDNPSIDANNYIKVLLIAPKVSCNIKLNTADAKVKSIQLIEFKEKVKKNMFKKTVELATNDITNKNKSIQQLAAIGALIAKPNKYYNFSYTNKRLECNECSSLSKEKFYLLYYEINGIRNLIDGTDLVNKCNNNSIYKLNL